VIVILISRKTDYTLRGLLYLLKQNDDKIVPSSEICKKMRIPSVFWAKIVQTLARKKIIESKKGKSGGIRILKKDASLGDIVSIMEPGLALNKCLRPKQGCFLKSACPIHKILADLDQQLKIKLSSVALSGLAHGTN